MEDLTWVGFESLEKKQLPLKWKSGACGAVLEFRGCVRNENEAKQVEGIEYEAHLSLAKKSLKEIREEILKQYPMLTDICIYHRIGKLGLGETSLLVGVASAHRKGAFEACQEIIDEIKRCTPVWKREIYVNKKADWLAGTSLREESSL